MSPSVITLFLIIVGITLIVTYYAAKRTKTANEFYTAGGGLTGWRRINRLAEWSGYRR